MLETITAETIDALVAVAGPGSGSPLLSVEVRHMGGALTPEMGAAVDGHVDAVREALAPWDTGKRYLNFAERPIDARDAYAAGAYARLRAIKTLVDPDDVIRANHPIEPIR
jgi:hypothetical protein